MPYNTPWGAALTIGDVYQPLNPLSVMAALETIKGARTRNRLSQMEAEEKARTLAGDKEFMKALTGYLSGPGTQQPQMPPEGFVGPMPPKTVPPSARWAQMPPEVQQKLVAASPEKAWALMEADQKRVDTDRKFRLETLKGLAEKAVTEGNDEAMQQVVAALAEEGINIPPITITGKNEWETVIPVVGGLGPDRQPVLDPATGQSLADGTYQVKGRGVGPNRRFTSILPAKDTGDADLKEFEQVTGTPASQRGTPGYQKAFLGYQRSKKEATRISVNMPGVRDFKDERDMRREFLALPEVKGFVEIESQMGRLNAAMAQSRRGGSKVAVDQALITILNKMLDPSSVVRESEYARTPSDMGLLNRLAGKLDKLNTGGAGLTDDERAAISRMANSFYSVAKQQYDAQVDFYTGLAKDYGYKPEHIVRLAGVKTGAQPKARDLAPATAYLKKAKTEADGIARYKALLQKGWTEQELDQAARAAGWQ